MIRYAKHNKVSYIIVDSTLEVNGVMIPVQVQVNVDKVEESLRPKVFRVVSVAFDRHLNFDKPKVQEKKSWWQKIFNT